VPLRVFPFGEAMYYVNGTPTDCVHLAISGLFPEDQDMVVSGINDGANLGDDVLYSGTVAAAIEGRFLGLSTLAISLVVRDGHHFDTAARVAAELVMRLTRTPLHASMILNVNVPDLPYTELRGFKATRLVIATARRQSCVAQTRAAARLLGGTVGRGCGRGRGHRF
jgi:5'-nucleotidase